MSAAHVALLSALCLIGGIVLQAIRPGDTMATMLMVAGTTALSTGYAKKHREASKARKDCVDLEKTATSLRAELFEATRTK